MNIVHMVFLVAPRGVKVSAATKCVLPCQSCFLQLSRWSTKGVLSSAYKNKLGLISSHKFQ